MLGGEGDDWEKDETLYAVFSSVIATWEGNPYESWMIVTRRMYHVDCSS
jgi:hypothetical protein